jgi:hypothetical protein
MSHDVYYLQQLLSILNRDRVPERVVESDERIVNSQSRIFSNVVSSLVTNSIRAYINQNSQSSFLETFLGYYINDDSNENSNYNFNEDVKENVDNVNANEYRGMVIRMDDLAPGGNKECSICFDEFTADSQIALTPCNHVYHLGCINKWYCRSPSCPVCRQEI